MFADSYQVKPEEEDDQVGAQPPSQAQLSTSLPSHPSSEDKGLMVVGSQISAGNSVNIFVNNGPQPLPLPVVVPSVPTFIPPKPSTFVGREDLLQRISQRLVRLQNVALLGIGGMGKTFIAQTIINDPTISATFHKRRYFARYDDFDPSQMTHSSFSERLASSIGLSNSGANSLTLVNIELSSAPPTLLVLDNAETFLDSSHGGRIAESIAGIGTLPNVALLLTSRSTILPSNLLWDRVQVPSLDPTSAADLFRRLYGQEIGSDILSQLLDGVGFHPLSIDLLAQVAIQNGWLPEELVKSWERQQAVLLDTGRAKVQSLAITIELSLKSPSLHEHAETIRQLLAVIAYLPQGINKSTLQSMYPDLPRIHTITELLCKYSLTLVKGPFITMLAPIRLYFTEDFQNFSGMPLMENVYRYYVSQLKEPVNEEWFLAENLNIEHLLASLLQKATFRESDLFSEIACTAGDYILSLSTIHPRPTSLQSILPNLEMVSNKPLLGRLSCRQYRKRKELSNIKGKCLLYLGILSQILGDLSEALKCFVKASKILRRARLHTPFSGLTFAVAVAYLPLGGFEDARKVLEADLNCFKRWASWVKSDSDTATAVILEALRIIRGQKKDARRLLKLGEAVREVQEKSLCELCLIYTMMAARMLGQDKEASKLIEFMLKEQETTFEGSILAANFALYIGDNDQALRYLLDIEALSTGAESDDAITFYQMLAVCKYLHGEAVEARMIARKLADQPKSLMAITALAWINGWIELHDGNMTAAADFMRRAVTVSKDSANMITTALASRALGEIASVEKNNPEAVAQFEQVAHLCTAMNISDAYLFEFGWAFWKLDARFKGWKEYSNRTSCGLRPTSNYVLVSI